MITRVANGEIGTVIVKDLSRFGRNHLHVGIYTTEFFPKHNVRFIAINDNVDTFTTDMETDISIPIKNIINEIYAVDTSRKIKAVYMAWLPVCFPSSPFALYTALIFLLVSTA